MTSADPDKPATQDAADAISLYSTLEDVIVPLYYANRNGDGVPTGWIQIMKNAIRTCTPEFSMRRMVKEYTERFYLPAATTGSSYSGKSRMEMAGGPQGNMVVDSEYSAKRVGDCKK